MVKKTFKNYIEVLYFMLDNSASFYRERLKRNTSSTIFLYFLSDRAYLNQQKKKDN